MNLILVSPFVYLASEKISAENLFEGFNVDLQSTVDLIKIHVIVYPPKLKSGLQRLQQPLP